jgi:fermentation-respiration switch protein FrsA (DUF1100 family)
MIACSLFSQGITGQWNGVLKVPGAQLRIVFHVNKTDSGYVSTMDSPDQGVKDIQVTKTSFENSVLKLEVAMGGIHYEGALTRENQIVGEFRQATFAAPMILTRDMPAKVVITKPQDPVEPYPYYSEEVKFTNPRDKAVLAGTLTLPGKEGRYPVVVLISGSGPQNRNEELLGHRPFLVLSDYLTRNGIGVLRYDDRGTAESTGDFKRATTSILATDVEAAVSYLLTRKEVDKKKIGLLGHSEGGTIAPMVAARNKNIRYIVLMAGPGIPGRELLSLQQDLIGKANGLAPDRLARNKEINQKIFDLVQKTTDEQALKTTLKEYLMQIASETPSSEKPGGISDEEMVNQQISQVTSPWLREFLTYDPALTLRKVKCPVLALNGGKDLQVPPRENLSALKSNLEKGGNKKVTVREYPNLNHIFQECKTGAPSEYAEIQQTLSPQVLNDIAMWIKARTK